VDTHEPEPHIKDYFDPRRSDPNSHFNQAGPVIAERSQIDVLADHFDRAYSFYLYAVNLNDDSSERHDDAGKTLSGCGTGHAVRMMRECVVQLSRISSKTYYEVARKARVLRENLHDLFIEVPSKEEGTSLNCNDVMLLTSILQDIMDLAGIAPVFKSDFTFAELIPDYPESVHAIAPLRTMNAVAGVSPTCPVERMFNDAERFISQHNVLDAYGKNHKSLESLASEAIGAITARGPFEQAISAQGAVFQLMLASSEAGSMEAYDKESQQLIADMRLDRIERSLISVRAFIERQFCLPHDGRVQDYFMPDRSSPDQALKRVSHELASKHPEDAEFHHLIIAEAAE